MKTKSIVVSLALFFCAPFLGIAASSSPSSNSQDASDIAAAQLSAAKSRIDELRLQFTEQSSVVKQQERRIESLEQQVGRDVKSTGVATELDAARKHLIELRLQFTDESSIIKQQQRKIDELEQQVVLNPTKSEVAAELDAARKRLSELRLLFTDSTRVVKQQLSRIAELEQSLGSLPR